MRRQLLAASISLLCLTLAACSDGGEQADNQPPPAPVEPAPAQPSAQERLDDATRKLQDAARQAGEAAQQGADALMQQGREALKDAGPTIDKAGEIAGQVGRSMQELADRARRDFDTAVSDLEKRLNDAGARTSTEARDPAASLSPLTELRADTRAAARAHAAGIGPAYVGAWALNDAECGRIDREAVENFAVITPTTIRRSEAVCNFAASDMTDGKATVAASCIAEGEAEDREITFSMPSDDSLSIATAPGMSIAVQFVRCNLPG